MTTSRGYIYTAFGSEYDKQCAYSAFSLRKFSAYPITVITNLDKRIRHRKWQDVPGVNFQYVVATDNENRRFKTRSYLFSPYDETLMLDTDVLALNNKLERIFDHLQVYDMAFPYVFTYTQDQKIPLIYKRAMIMFHCQFPLVIHQGGVCVFKKNSRTAKLFEDWHRAWLAFGGGREMQCLACMIQKSTNVVVGLLPGELYGRPNSTVIGHYYGKYSHEGLPRITKNKPFNHKSDWVKV